ncbi:MULTISPECIES: thermonuclease family protein [Chelativorans]|uniref:Nuclease (SNase-like) n=1 Tax=Chelativorans sp. (strain BNC1) TaxID=266779 RepID=Q11I25_CHESB|nr:MULTISPECIES: thermonuclease family protein [Chelativorans]
MRVSRRNYWRSRRNPRRPHRWADILLSAGILTLLALTVARLDQVATRHLSGSFRINDGDSLTINGERIRLRGIDAPELDQQCSLEGLSYACGQRARQALSQLTNSGSLSCSGWERDRYGRLLARCEAGGRDLGQTMVETGWAISYGDYTLSEAEAKRAGKGLWAGAFEDPRDWRTRNNSPNETPHDWLGRLVNFLRQVSGMT